MPFACILLVESRLLGCYGERLGSISVLLFKLLVCGRDFVSRMYWGVSSRCFLVGLASFEHDLQPIKIQIPFKQHTHIITVVKANSCTCADFKAWL